MVIFLVFRCVLDVFWQRLRREILKRKCWNALTQLVFSTIGPSGSQWNERLCSSCWPWILGGSSGCWGEGVGGWSVRMVHDYHMEMQTSRSRKHRYFGQEDPWSLVDGWLFHHQLCSFDDAIIFDWSLSSGSSHTTDSFRMDWCRAFRFLYSFVPSHCCPTFKSIQEKIFMRAWSSQLTCDQ